MNKGRIAWWSIAMLLLVTSGAMWQEVRRMRLPGATQTAAPDDDAAGGPAAVFSAAHRLASAPAGAAGPMVGKTTPMPVDAGPDASAAAESRALRPGEVEVCGIGIVQGPVAATGAAGSAADIELPAGLHERWSREVDALVAALATSGTPGAEAAAALMQGRLADLVKLALRDRDPRTVQWAVQACQGRGQAEPTCLLVSSRLWVEVEPDNGMAWLALLAAEPAAQADAVYGLTRAHRFDERIGALVAVVDAAAPLTVPAHQRANLLVQAMGIDMARSLPSFAPLSQVCPANVAADANRREQCSAIAELLANRSNTLLARGFAAPLGERAGWSAGRVAALRRQQEQAQRRLSEHIEAWLKLPPLGCEQLTALSGHFRDLARRGEWVVATESPASR